MEAQLLINSPEFIASGRYVKPEQSLDAERSPLIVAIHGGGFTSEFFDIPGYSLLDRAASRGVGVLALDRLGHGSSRAHNKDNQSFVSNAEWISETLDRLWPELGKDHSAVVLVGHSIGAALVLLMASQSHSWPLAGVAVSGAALTPNPALESYFERFAPDTWVTTSSDNKDRLMFGKPGTVDEGVIERVRAAYAPISTRELLEINMWWPPRVRQTLQSIQVPVHYRLGAQEVLWIVNDVEVRQLSDLISKMDGSSAAMVQDAGHCIDFHKVGANFQEEQIAFAHSCCREPTKSRLAADP